MPNVSITHLQADDWTELYAPVPCNSLSIVNADPQAGFSFRTLPAGDNFATQMDVAAGFGIPICGEGGSFQTDYLIGEVMGGDILVLIGVGLPRATA